MAVLCRSCVPAVACSHTACEEHGRLCAVVQHNDIPVFCGYCRTDLVCTALFAVRDTALCGYHTCRYRRCLYRDTLCKGQGQAEKAVDEGACGRGMLCGKRVYGVYAFLRNKL